MIQSSQNVLVRVRRLRRPNFYVASLVFFGICGFTVNYDIFKGDRIEWDRGGLNATLATVDSLVERGTFVIDDSVFGVTLDKMLVDGHYYSDKAPGFSIVLAATFAPLNALGLSIEHHKLASAWILTFFGVAIPGVLTLFLFLRTAARLAPSAPPNHLLLTRNLLGFGTLWVTFSGLLNYHLFAGLLVTAGVLVLFRRPLASRGDAAAPPSIADGSLAPLFGGLLFGVLYTFDIPTGGIFLAVMAALFLLSKRFMALLLWCCGGGVFVALYHWFNFSITGKLLPPFLYRSEFYQFPGSVHTASSLTGESGTGALLSITHLVDVYRNFFGSMGLFVLSPILVLAVVGHAGTLRTWWNENGLSMWKDPRMFLGLGATLQVLFYNCVVPSAIGSVYGVRHALAIMPLLMMGLLSFLGSHRFPAWAKAIAVISVVFALAGAFQDKQNTYYMAGWTQLVPAYSFFHSVAQFKHYGR